MLLCATRSKLLLILLFRPPVSATVNRVALGPKELDATFAALVWVLVGIVIPADRGHRSNSCIFHHNFFSHGRTP